MPFIEDPAAPRDLTNYAPAVEPELDPSLGDLYSAAFRGNVVGSYLASRGQADPYKIEEGYNPLDDLEERYIPYANDFAGVFNRKASIELKLRIDQEEQDRRTLAAGGWSGVLANFVAGVVDLPTLIPIGGLAVGVGRSTASTIGRTALLSALDASVSEAALQSTQVTRTATDSAVNVAGSAALGGMLGGSILLGGYLGRNARLLALPEQRRLSGVMEDAQRPEFDAATDILHRELTDMSLNSAGAAAARVDSLDDLSIAGRAASSVAKATAQLNPLLRTLQSPSVAVRGIASRMMDTPVYLKKNLNGEGDTAAETAMHEYSRGAVVQAMEKQKAAYLEARKGGLAMPEADFREEVGKAMRRNDQSDIPGVSAAAAAWRTHVIEPLKQRAIANGLLPADVSVTTADSYFSRMYNRPKIEANSEEFRAVVRDWVSGSLETEILRTNTRADGRLMTLQTQINELETGILRRGESLNRRRQGLEVEPGEMSEADIVSFVKRVQNGETGPQVETLSEWLKRQKGGIFDPNGELAAVFPNARTIPGLLRKTRRTDLNSKGGDGLDDIVLRAWEDGFLNDAAGVRMGSARDTVSERPSIREFLDALDADLRGERVVRLADLDAARAADEFDMVMRALDRAGVDFKRPMFGTSEDLRGLAERVVRVLDDLDRERVGKLRGQADDQMRRKLGDFVSDADRQAYVDEIVDDVFNQVTGKTHDGDVPSNLTVTKRGPLAERTFNIPDERIEKFLDSDAEFIGRRYARVMAADIELTERFGSPDMKDALIEVSADYGKLRARIEGDMSLGTDAKRKALEKLSAKEKADIRDIKGARDLLRGHYRPEIQHTTWARIGRAANTFNYIRAMGGVVVASLTDAVRPAMVHGLSAYMQDGIGPLIRNSAGVKLSITEAKLAGAISEKWLASRLATLAEITDPYSIRSPFEKLLDNAGAGFSKMTGLLHWNDFQKGLAATITQNRILKNAEIAAAKGFDALPARERAYMGFLGIGQGKAEDIGKLFAARGETLDGVRVANSEQWGDDVVAAGLRRAYRAAINKDVDSIIVTKGVGDVPLMANTPLGRALLQFKSFAIASNQRVLMRGLQEDKARFVGGLIGMSAVGMFVYWLKQLESGRPVSNNPGTWIAEGIDRTGIFSVGFEINNAFEKAGAPGAFTAASAIGRLVSPGADSRQPASRFAVRSTVGGFLGPSFGAATDAVGLMSTGFDNMKRAATGEDLKITGGDIQAARRLTPFASLPYWRWAIDGMIVPELKEAAGATTP